jgi:hypothetical protein
MTANFDHFSDADLRDALQRREPPDGFAERTLARIKQAPPSRQPRAPFRPWRRWAALAAAASIVIVVGSAQYRAQQKEAAARKAAQELTLAMRITSDTLREVQNKLTHHK